MKVVHLNPKIEVKPDRKEAARLLQEEMEAKIKRRIDRKYNLNTNPKKSA